jgi:hypothetical protein
MLGVTVEIVLILAIVYVLPIAHIARSDRTPPKMKWFFIAMVVVLGLFGYFMWWLMTTPGQKKNLDPAQIPAFPVAPKDGTALIYVFRSAFFGALVKYRVYIDDQQNERAAIQGSRYATIAVEPGKHALWVKSYRWLEFPFEAQAGQTLAFCLDAQTDTPLTNTVAGWFDELNARQRIARLQHA